MSTGLPSGVDDDDIADIAQVVFDANPGAPVRRVIDADGDTYIEVDTDPETDADIVRFYVGNELRATINNEGLIAGNNVPALNVNTVLGSSDDTGADWVNEQVGNLGSAFHILRKANGTLTARTNIQNGEKIGGVGYSAHNGDDTDTYVGAEIGAFAVGYQDATNGGARLTFSITPVGTRAADVTMQLLDNYDVYFAGYPGSRIDGFTDQAFHADVNGVMQQSLIRHVWSEQMQGGRFYLRRGQTRGLNTTYGIANQNWSSTYTANNPSRVAPGIGCIRDCRLFRVHCWYRRADTSSLTYTIELWRQRKTPNSFTVSNLLLDTISVTNQSTTSNQEFVFDNDGNGGYVLDQDDVVFILFTRTDNGGSTTEYAYNQSLSFEFIAR